MTRRAVGFPILPHECRGTADSCGREWLPTLFSRVLAGLRPRELSCGFPACAGPEFLVCSTESPCRVVQMMDRGGTRACRVLARDRVEDRLVLHFHLAAKVLPACFVGAGNADGAVDKLAQEP